MENLLLNNSSRFLKHVTRVLGERLGQEKEMPNPEIEWQTTAGVLMLLGHNSPAPNSDGEPCLILNKRSLKVRQPGDLCFPGGGISLLFDSCLARFFSLPVASLGRWPYWPDWKQLHPGQARILSIIWATGLRESFEEMRLNPFGVKFLGPLPPQSLVMFKRTMYPMVGWINRQKRFFPNWEVEKVIYVSFRDLLNHDLYGRYRLKMGHSTGKDGIVPMQDFPCFRLQNQEAGEILWGATYRITMNFLKLVFDFTPPDLKSLPVVEGSLDENYVTGNQ